MCKIYVSFGINDTNREGHKKLFHSMMEVMSKEYSHRDGIGYAAVDKDGNLFGEKWLKREDALKMLPIIPKGDKVNSSIEKFKGFLKVEEKEPEIKYGSFGNLNWQNVTAITLHTRLATTGKEFKNTHPFVENDTSLIHNGVINNHEKFRKSQSTCDSEVILTQYLDHNVNTNINDIKNVTKNIAGYYACGVFSRNENKDRILDVFKSSNAQLIAGYIKELDSIVFTSLTDQLEMGCKLAGLTLETLYQIESNNLIRINPITGEILDSIEFQDKTTDYYNWNNSDWRNWSGYDEEDAEYVEKETKSTKPKHNEKKKIKKIIVKNGVRITKEYDIDDPALLDYNKELKN